jgi:glycosyltransferase involved in cell wall biosynthesis
MPGPSSTSPSGSNLTAWQSVGAGASISVVVPTRDRPAALRRCLHALASQTVSDQLEVIVVDDGSIDGDAVAEAVSRWPATHLLRQSPSGPAAARNRGARAAKGSFVCFTDDDCEPRADWVACLVAALQGQADAVGGRTIGMPAKAVVRASELISRAPALAAGDETLAFTPSNNFACRAEVMAAVPFDERFPAAAGEDRNWCERLLRSGGVLRYEPSAVLVHHHDSSLGSFFRQQLRYGRGAFQFRRLGSESRSLERPRFYAQLVQRGFAEGPAAGMLVCAAQLATAVGFGAEWLKTRSRKGFSPL